MARTDQALLESFLTRAKEIGRVVADAPALHESLGAPGARRLVTVNLFELRHYVDDPAYRATVDSADHWTADGWPVAAAFRQVGIRTERVTGSGLCADLLTLPSAAGLQRIAVLGSEDHIVAAFSRRLGARDREVVFRETGSRLGWTQQVVLDGLQASEPDLVLIAVGTPFGVPIAADLQKVVPCPVLSVGAGVGLAVGLEPRSPAAVQRVRLEWAWRLAADPRRLSRRYLVECAPLVPVLRAAARSVAAR